MRHSLISVGGHRKTRLSQINYTTLVLKGEKGNRRMDMWCPTYQRNGCVFHPQLKVKVGVLDYLEVLIYPPTAWALGYFLGVPDLDAATLAWSLMLAQLRMIQLIPLMSIYSTGLWAHKTYNSSSSFVSSWIAWIREAFFSQATRLAAIVSCSPR
jgi:hypothetical protein